MQPFSSFAKHGLHPYALLPQLSTSDRLTDTAAKKKSRKQKYCTVKEASKAFCGYPRAEVSSE